MEIPELLTVDGVEYKVEELSDTVKKLLGIYQIWAKELDELRLDVAKHEAALRDLSREISLTVQKSKQQVEDKSE